MHLTTLLTPLLAASLASAQTVYLIRHGEKPDDGGNGLTTQGEQRAQCLRNVFGASSQYNIRYIIAEQPKSSQLFFYFVDLCKVRSYILQLTSKRCPFLKNLFSLDIRWY